MSDVSDISECPCCQDDGAGDPDFGPEAYKTHVTGCACPDCRAWADDEIAEDGR